MFTWILIIIGVIIVIGLIALLGSGGMGMAPKGVDPENVRNIKRNNAGKGDYFGGM